MENIEYISEKGFPRVMRKVVNRCASRLNRLWQVQVEDTPTPKFLESEEKVTLILPRNFRGGSGAGSAVKVGFGWYQSPFLGGNPPANQGLKVRFYDGYVNGNVPAANNDAEFTLTPNLANIAILQTYQAADGTVNHAVINIGSSVPDDPVGDIDIAPATSSRRLWTLTTDATTVISAVAGRIGDIDVIPQEYGRTCEGALMRMFWSAGGAG